MANHPHPIPPSPSADALQTVAFLEAALGAAAPPHPVTPAAVIQALRPLRDVAWDILPTPAPVPVARVIVHAGAGPARRADIILVDATGHAFIEGHVPIDPVRAALYIDLRRRALAVQRCPTVADAASPTPGRSASLAAGVRALVRCVLDRIRDEDEAPPPRRRLH